MQTTLVHGNAKNTVIDVGWSQTNETMCQENGMAVTG
jgi:hypothetical protein